VGQGAVVQEIKRAAANAVKTRNKELYIVVGFLLVVALIVIIANLSGGGLSGTWDGEYGDVFVFSGNNFEWMGAKGTYSVTGNTIELAFPNGEVYVLPFSRTENTFTIDGERYKRR
jgi:hypothetical protein